MTKEPKFPAKKMKPEFPGNTCTSARCVLIPRVQSVWKICEAVTLTNCSLQYSIHGQYQSANEPKISW